MSSEVTCPCCEAVFGVQMEAGIPADQRFTMRLTPAPGARMQARTVGETIAGIGELHAAVSKEHGIATTTLVERIDTAEDGTITVELALLSSKAELVA